MSCLRPDLPESLTVCAVSCLYSQVKKDIGRLSASHGEGGLGRVNLGAALSVSYGGEKGGNRETEGGERERVKFIQSCAEHLTCSYSELVYLHQALSITILHSQNEEMLAAVQLCDINLMHSSWDVAWER